MQFPSAPTVPLAAVTGAGTALGTNLMMGAAAGPDVPVIAGGVNVVIEWIKNRPWFHEQTWTVPLLVVLSFAISLGIWHFLLQDNIKAIVNGFGILANAHINYGALKPTGLPVFRPTLPEHRWEPRLPVISDIADTLDAVNDGTYAPKG